MANTTKKVPKIIIKFIVGAVLVVIWFFVTWWDIFFADFLPREQTNYKNYNSFYKRSVTNFFPSELPDSATNVKYYYYSGMLDEKFGVSFVVDDEDYKELKHYYLYYYYPTKNSRSLDYFFKQQLTDEFVHSERLDFIENIVEEELDQYTFMVYEKGTTEHYQIKSGGLYNDETNEFIIIFFHDHFFMEE